MHFSWKTGSKMEPKSMPKSFSSDFGRSKGRPGPIVNVFRSKRYGKRMLQNRCKKKGPPDSDGGGQVRPSIRGPWAQYIRSGPEGARGVSNGRSWFSEVTLFWSHPLKSSFEVIFLASLLGLCVARWVCLVDFCCVCWAQGPPGNPGVSSPGR